MDLTALQNTKQKIINENLFLISKLREQQKIEANQEEERGIMILQQRKKIFKFSFVTIFILGCIYFIQKWNIKKPTEFKKMEISQITLNDGLLEAFENSKKVKTMITQNQPSFMNQKQISKFNDLRIQIENKENLKPSISIAESSSSIKELLSPLIEQFNGGSGGALPNFLKLIKGFPGVPGFPTP